MNVAFNIKQQSIFNYASKFYVSEYTLLVKLELAKSSQLCIHYRPKVILLIYTTIGANVKQ
jgi:hypothetical protein